MNIQQAVSQTATPDNKIVIKLSKPSETLFNLIDKAYHLCRFREALQLLNKLENPSHFYAYKTIIAAAAIFENAQLTDDEAQHLCQLAYSVLELQNLCFAGFEIEIIENCVHYWIYVDLPVDKIFDVNWELAGVFAENVEDMRCEALNFQYSCVEILRERREYERHL